MHIKDTNTLKVNICINIKKESKNYDQDEEILEDSD
jgi:hypothetical protein